MKRGRGRPKSDSKGAREGVANVARYMEAHGLSRSALALQMAMNPSSVTRALGQETPRWTPSLKKICVAVNALKVAGMPAAQAHNSAAARLERLLSAPEPAADAVLDILDSVQHLVDTLSKPRRKDR